MEKLRFEELKSIQQINEELEKEEKENAPIFILASILADN